MKMTSGQAFNHHPGSTAPTITMNNPLIQEVRDAREGLAAKFDFDLHRIIEDAMVRQAAQRTVNRQPGPRPEATLPELGAVILTGSTTASK